LGSDNARHAETLLRAAANCAGAYRAWAGGVGMPSRLWDDLSCGDLALPVNLPPNNATLLSPSAPANFEEVLERIAEFFAGRPGGGYQIWSAWPTPDLTADGYLGWSCPCMIRDAGGEAPMPPPELEIVDARDERALGEAESVVNEVYGAGAPPGSMFRPESVSDTFRVWVGRVDGRPVSSATAYVGDGFVGLYAVATAAEARGRGYGEAVSWAATNFRPDLPATLQASPMGRPVYERMGYRTVAQFTVWERDRR